MSRDEWTERANAFGQMALDASKAIQKKTVQQGGEAQALAQLIINKTKAYSKAKTRWDRRHGIWESDKGLEQAMQDVEHELKNSVRSVQLTVASDFNGGKTLAQSSWREQLPKFPDSLHEVQLHLQFSESCTGTLVEYNWMVDDFPKGEIASRVVRETNQTLEATLEPWPITKRA